MSRIADCLIEIDDSIEYAAVPDPLVYRRAQALALGSEENNADASSLELRSLEWRNGRLGTVAQTVVVDHPGRVTHAILVGTAPPGKNPVAIQQVFLDRAFKPVNDLDDETVLFFDPRYKVSRDAAKASRDRIYARPGVAERIPSTEAEIKAISRPRPNITTISKAAAPNCWRRTPRCSSSAATTTSARRWITGLH